MLRKWVGGLSHRMLELLMVLVPAANLTAEMLSTGYFGLSWVFVEL